MTPRRPASPRPIRPEAHNKYRTWRAFGLVTRGAWKVLSRVALGIDPRAGLHVASGFNSRRYDPEHAGNTPRLRRPESDERTATGRQIGRETLRKNPVST